MPETQEIIVHSENVKKGDFLILGSEIYKIILVFKNHMDENVIQFRASGKIHKFRVHTLIMTNGYDLEIIRRKKKKKS